LQVLVIKNLLFFADTRMTLNQSHCW